MKKARSIMSIWRIAWSPRFQRMPGIWRRDLGWIYFLKCYGVKVKKS